ncbi:hypothetical protein [Nonomuraea sp. NPDC049141]|uniref:hypothetical protein n=1 Tax=Nonomuraea sp. NPDC049141 TaxID=3155500 RepID=UPI0033C41312
MIAVLDLSGKYASGVLAVTKKRGGPVAGRGAAVAMGAAREVAIGRGDGRAAVSDGGAIGPEGMEGEGPDSEGTAVVSPLSETRSAAGSPQAPTSASMSRAVMVTRGRKCMK